MADTMTYEAQIEQNEAEIRGLINLLEQTDYIALKLAEGAATEEEYSEILEKRKEWRAKINEHQASAATLQAQMLSAQAETEE